MEEEMLLARLLLLQVRLTKEANTTRGVTKKSDREYTKILKDFCEITNIDYDVVEHLINP